MKWLLFVTGLLVSLTTLAGVDEEVRDLQGYLRACVRADGDPAAIPRGPWDAWRQREHDEVNVERAAMLARGDTSIPPSMLRAAGLI